MSVHNPYKKKNPYQDLKEEMAHNRSTLYRFFNYETDLMMKFLRIGKGQYKVFQVPWDWDTSYLLINNMRITDFQAVILFSNELVVRFEVYGERQINIPYKDIEYIAVSNDLDIGYRELYMRK